MPGDPGAHREPNLLTHFLLFFFYLIYEPMAWSYDLVSWVVSLGRWKCWIHTTLPELPGPRILELGHGPGHLLLTLRSSGALASGVDRSRQMSLIAHNRLLRKGIVPLLVRASAENLPFPRALFDQIVATFPSEYILKPTTLSETHRILTPAGKLIVLPVAWIRGNLLWERAAAWLFRVTGQAATWDTRYSVPLRRAGFSVEEKLVKSAGSEIMLIMGTKND